MAQNEMIDEIVAQQAWDDFVRLKKEIKETVANMAELSKSARGAFGGLGDSKTLLDLIKHAKEAQHANKETIAAVDDLGKAYKATNAIMAQHNGTSKAFISNLKGVEDAEKKAAQAATENAKATLVSAKASTENTKKKEIETRYTILLTKEKERLDKAAAKEEANLKKQQSAYAQLSAEYNKAAKAAQDLGARQFMLQREVSLGNNVQVNNTELARLGPQLADAQAQALKLHTALLSVDQAVGKSQRNVGNYNSAQFAMSQLLREAPSFAYSFSTGLLALSNNIPILVDEINKMKVANEALKASGQATIPIWKTLLGAITSPVGIITIATAAITIFAARMQMSGNSIDKAEQSLKKYNEAVKNSTDSVYANTISEQGRAEVLLAIARDTKQAMDIRVEAVKKLQAEYPNYLGNLSQEAILTGDITKEVTMLNEALFNKALMEASAEKVKLAAKRYSEVKDEIEAVSKVYDELQKKVDKPGLDKEARGLLQFSVIEKKEELRDLREQLKAIKGDIDKYNAEFLNYGKAAAGVIVSPTKDPKVKTPKDNTLKNENDLTKELYDEYAKRLKIAAEVQKAISEDESKSMDERLMAYRQFAELSFESQALGLSAQMDVVDNNLREIEQIEKKSADKRTQQEKDLLERKALLQQQYNNISAEYDLLEQQHIEKTAQAIVAIQQDEVSKRLDAIKSLTNNVELVEAAALIDLQQKWKEGTISYKQYIFDKKAIEDKFQKEKYQQIVDYLQLEINALAAAGVDTRRMQEALNAALKHLYDSDLKNFEDAQKAKEEARQELEQKGWQFAGEAVNSLHQISDNYYQSRLDKEEELLNAIRDRRDAEIQAIEDSLASEKDKSEAIKAITSQALLQEKQVDREQRRLKRQMAIADRVAALANIGLAQAQAQAANLINFVKNAVYGAAIAALIAGMGIAQTAAVLSKPLPEYGDGVLSHPGGYAVLGDKRERELVKEPGKDPYWSADVPTVYNLRAGTSVLPERLITPEQLITHNMGFMTPKLLNNLGLNYVNDYSGLERKLDENASRIEIAVKNIPVQNFSLKDGQWESSIKVGGSRIKYINKNFD